MNLEFFKNLITDISENIFEISIAICLILSAIISFLIIKIIKKNIIFKRKMKIDDCIDHLSGLNDFDGKYTGVLGLVRKYIKGDGYFLYLYDSERNRYKLKRVFFETKNFNVNHGGVDVNYGRIIPYARESYAPPLVFSGAVIPKKISLLMEGRFPVIVIPIGDDKGFISVSTRKKVSIKNKQTIEYIASGLEKIFKAFTENSEKSEPFEKESKNDNENTEKDVLDFSLFVMGAKAGFFIKIENDYGELLVLSGFNLKTEGLMHNDSNFLANIEGAVSKKDYLIVNKESYEFFKIPIYLIAEGFNWFIIEKTEKGIITFCYTKEPNESYLKEYRRKAVELMTIKMAEKSKTDRKKISAEFYIKKLKDLARLIDQEESYSIGFSELISHYASVITSELKLDPEESKNIKIAAYLSNIGVTAIPDSILSKNGVYTSKEYETAKIHSEAGALFVALLTGNNSIQQYIRYHHERPDGLGYPEGLKGLEIPIGARIITVAQTFLSKIKGRNYREPLSFEKVIAILIEESGKSLDEQIVSCLINWFKRKQKNPIFNKKTLGACWEMRCAAKAICLQCPVYKNTDKPCWMFEKNNCLAHGNTCDTCHIYTEFISREKLLGTLIGEEEA